MGDILSGIGSLITGNADQQQANQAGASADQDTAQQNAYNQQIQQIIGQMLGTYNSDYAGLNSGVGGAYSSLLNNGSNAGGTAAAYQNFLNNPDATLASIIGTQGAGTLLNQSQGHSALAHMTPAAFQSVLAELNKTNAASSSGLTNLTGTDNSVIGSDTGPGAAGGSLAFLQNQMLNGGVSPALFANAVGQNQASNQANLNSLRNSLGGMTNIGAVLNNQNLANTNSTANLLANLTGQSAQLQQSAGTDVASIMQQLNAQKLQAAGQTDAATLNTQNQNYGNFQNAEQFGLTNQSNLQAQQMQQLIASIAAAGGVTGQKDLMLGQSAANAMGNLGNVAGFNQYGNTLVTGQEGVLGGLSSQAGQQASGAAEQQQYYQQQASQNNPFNAFATMLGGGNGTGGASGSSPFSNFGSMFGGGGGASNAALTSQGLAAAGATGDSAALWAF